MAKFTKKFPTSTHFKKSESVEILIKREDYSEIVKTAPKQHAAIAMPCVDPIIKIEEKDVDLKSQLARLVNKEGSS